MRRTLFAAFFLLAAISMGACAYASTTVKVPPAPAYKPTSPIPITVGLVVNEAAGVESQGRSRTKAKSTYGPLIAAELKKLQVFKGIVYPYEKGAAADVVLLLDIKGKWEYFNAERQPYDTWAGDSVAHYAEGTHDVKVIMTVGGRRIINDSIPVKSRSRYSGQDYDLVANTLNQAQASRIAITLANFLQGKQDHIMAQVQTAGNTSPNAAPSGAQAEVKGGQPGAKTKTTEKLRELEELHSSGVLSDQDFSRAKNRLIQMQKLEDLYKSGVLTEQEYNRARARVSGR